MKHYLLLFSLIFLVFSCTDEPVKPIEDEPVNCPYEKYSTADFEKIYQHMISQSIYEPSLYPDPRDKYLYSYPVFNPNNPCEIAYLRSDGTLWKFSFNTGEAQKLANNPKYSPDWSSKGWIIYTGTNSQLWKVKDNGDSLTQLSNEAAFNNDAKWSPDGTMYAYSLHLAGENRLANENGVIIKNLPFRPINWLDNKTIIGLEDYKGIVSYNIFTSETKVLHSAEPLSASKAPFDRKRMLLYYNDFAGFTTQRDDQWLRFNLVNGTTDTLRTLYDSYGYLPGNYSEITNKIVIGLARSTWKDSTRDQRYNRAHILIMNPDGTGERLVLLPE
jgi:hypothetical protein